MRLVHRAVVGALLLILATNCVTPPPAKADGYWTYARSIVDGRVAPVQARFIGYLDSFRLCSMSDLPTGVWLRWEVGRVGSGVIGHFYRSTYRGRGCKDYRLDGLPPSTWLHYKVCGLIKETNPDIWGTCSRGWTFGKSAR